MGTDNDYLDGISGRALLAMNSNHQSVYLEQLHRQQLQQKQNQAMQNVANQMNVSLGINQSALGLQGYPPRQLITNQGYFDYARDTYVAGSLPFAEPAPIPKPKTNLQWLDERVEEMRFKL